jgi:Flavin reductase like domain
VDVRNILTVGEKVGIWRMVEIRCFSTASGRSRDRMSGWNEPLRSFEFEIVAEHPAGDHSIVVGRVDDVRTSPLKDPLVFFAGAFGALR